MKTTSYYTQLKSIITILLLSTVLGACATIEGAGKDIEKAGEAIQGPQKTKLFYHANRPLRHPCISQRSCNPRINIVFKSP